MGDRSSAVQVARGATYLLIENAVTTLLQVVAFAFIARLISTSQMGLLAVLSMVLGLAQLIGPLALPSAIARFVPEEMSQGRGQSAAAVFYQSTRISLILSAALAATCFLFASQISAVFSTEPMIFQLLAVDIFVTSGLTLNLAVALIGAQMIRDYSLVTIAYTAVRQALIVGLILLFHEFLWILYAWVISDSLYVLMMAIPVVRVLGRPNFGFGLRRLLGFSLPLLPGNSITFAYGWYDRALLVPYESLATLGIYNVTLTAFGVLSSIPSGMATALYPAYAAIQSIKGKAGLEDAIRVASRYVSFIAIPLTLGLLATARPALSLFVGAQYEYGTTVLQIITIFFAFTLMGNAFGNILPLLDQTAASSAVRISSVAVSLVTALLLLPQFGMSGAAVSRGVGMLINFVLTLALAGRRIRLSFDLEALWKSSAASIAMAIAVWLAQYVSYNRDLLPAYALLGGVVYLAGLRLLKAIHASDVHLAKQFLGRRYEPEINLLSKVLRAEP